MNFELYLWPETLGKTMAVSEPPKSRLAHLLQGIEAQMLGAVMKQFGRDIVLLQHDGFTTARPIDIELAENVIADATGIRFSLSEDRL